MQKINTENVNNDDHTQDLMDQNDDESEFDDDDRTNDGTLTDDKPQINGSDEETKACNDDKQEI